MTGSRPPEERAPVPDGAGPDRPAVPDAAPEPGGPRVRRPIAWRRPANLAVMVAAIVVVASVVLGGAAAAAVMFYGDYGPVANETNAEAQRALAPRFAGEGVCTSCHEPQAAAQDASAHVNVDCEGCHGPAAVHATNDELARTTILAMPEGEICITCHAVTGGRGETIGQIDPERHFSGDQCSRCHDPHSIRAVRPPVVTHPLERLPACTTCHAPDGLKEIPSGHEPVADGICLSCHGAGADGGR
jgi:hypothetical protein